MEHTGRGVQAAVMKWKAFTVVAWVFICDCRQLEGKGRRKERFKEVGDMR